MAQYAFDSTSNTISHIHDILIAHINTHNFQCMECGQNMVIIMDKTNMTYFSHTHDQFTNCTPQMTEYIVAKLFLAAFINISGKVNIISCQCNLCPDLTNCTAQIDDIITNNIIILRDNVIVCEFKLRSTPTSIQSFKFIPTEVLQQIHLNRKEIQLTVVPECTCLSFLLPQVQCLHEINTDYQLLESIDTISIRKITSNKGRTSDKFLTTNFGCCNLFDTFYQQPFLTTTNILDYDNLSEKKYQEDTSLITNTLDYSNLSTKEYEQDSSITNILDYEQDSSLTTSITNILDYNDLSDEKYEQDSSLLLLVDSVDYGKQFEREHKHDKFLIVAIRLGYYGKFDEWENLSYRIRLLSLHTKKYAHRYGWTNHPNIRYVNWINPYIEFKNRNKCLKCKTECLLKFPKVYCDKCRIEIIYNQHCLVREIILDSELLNRINKFFYFIDDIPKAKGYFDICCKCMTKVFCVYYYSYRQICIECIIKLHNDLYPQGKYLTCGENNLYDILESYSV